MDDDTPDTSPKAVTSGRKSQAVVKADRRAAALKANMARRKAQARARAAGGGQAGEEQEQP